MDEIGKVSGSLDGVIFGDKRHETIVETLFRAVRQLAELHAAIHLRLRRFPLYRSPQP